MLIATHNVSGAEIREGSIITSFRGESWRYVRATRANSEGRDGLVMVESYGLKREMYAAVFDLRVIEVGG
jgi:hypothetical protein